MSIDSRKSQPDQGSQTTGGTSGTAFGPSTSIPQGARLASFGERVTYTFVQGKEVGSVHFDRTRGEIFLKGHNIRHMELEAPQMQVLEEMRLILQRDPQARHFAESYGAVLDKIIIEKSK